MSVHDQLAPRRRKRRFAQLASIAAVALGMGVLAAPLLNQAVPAMASVAQTTAATQADACGGLTALKLTNTTVVSAQVDTSGSFTIPAGQSGAGTVLTGLPAFCDVALTQTNPPASDQIHVEVWLPLSGWSGNFQGVGGGGYVTGISWSALATALQSGYSTASTDTGHTVAQGQTGSFSLNPDGTLNTAEITDFAYRAIHEMTVAGKDVTNAFYNSEPTYSYFNGCSTGGRQALGEAQRYPTDYNGILAGAPAVYFDELSDAQLWPEFVMAKAHDFLPQCKFNAFRTAVINRCEVTHGVNYGEIMNPFDCSFNAFSLVGTKTPCGTITRTDAQIMEEIWAGPTGKFTWFGIEPGTDSSGLANTTTANGVTTPSPFSIATGWFQYWVTQNPNFDWQTMSFAQFSKLSNEGVSKFPELDTDNPNLTAFRKTGGKLVVWAGLSDQIIPPGGVIKYYNKVESTLGSGVTRSFARLFLAPGDGHCGGDSVGPVPGNPFAAVVNWVQNGIAPSTILATSTNSSGGVVEARPLCAYPDGAKYVGSGSLAKPQNFVCARTFTS